jgi:tetratricopeptide (TPR) repeat protein
VLAAAIGVGVVLRLAHLARLYESPFAASLVLDARAYDEWAREIAAGEWIGRAAFWVDPLYAYVLAAMYGIAGHSLLLPRLANLVFGVATAFVAARIAERLWSSRSAAVAAALFVGIFIPAIHFEGQIEKTALSVLLLACGVDLFLAGTSLSLLGAGVVGGLATLARGNVLLLLPLAAAALALGWDREPGDPLAAGRGLRLRRAGLLLAGAVPLILLATLHNHAATGEFVPTTTNLGINLYLGNHPGNLYGYYDPPDFLHPSTSTEKPDFRAEAERRSGTTLSDRALSDYWARQTWEAVSADPGLAAARLVRKLRLALNDDEVPDSDDVALVAGWSPVLRSPVLWFGQLLPLALLGAVVGRRRRGVRIVAAVAVIYLASLLPFFIMARLRVQLLPFMAVLGSGAAVWIATALQARRRRPLGFAAAILALGAVVAYSRPSWMAERRTASLAIGWHNLGATLADQGRTEEAVRAYERAVEIRAAAVPAALRALGRIHQERGDYARAEEAMRKVLELRPDSPSARAALLGLYDAMLADARWQNDARIQSRRRALGGPSGQAPPASPPAKVDPVASAIARARTLGSEGRVGEGIAVLQQAVRDGPYDEDLHYLLGQTMERHAPPEEMVEFFSQEVDRDQKPQTSHYFWAVGLERGGDLEGALAQLRRALEIDPAHEMSQWRWGLLLERQGRPEEALKHLEEAGRIHPDYEPAWRDAARVAEQLGRSADAEEYRRRAEAADPTHPRRFGNWARYLLEHGRHEAAWVEVHRLLAERPGDGNGLLLRERIRAAFGATPPPAIDTDASGSGGPATLPRDTRALLVANLSVQPPNTPAWIAYDGRDAWARDRATDLASAFKEAGWTVRRLGEAPFSLRPGTFIMAADDPPSAAASTAHDALDVAGLAPTVGTGYRAYAEERRRADPAWSGFYFEPEQEFVVAVGRRASNEQ